MNLIRIDLAHVARDLDLPTPSVERTVELLDEGNTVPFITRYRKDHTGGLDEEQIRSIQFVVGKLRQLAERKQTILKSIEAQGKLTPELANQIQNATTPKRLEDLYFPFKPKKQTLATKAREQGLEPLAVEILEANPAAADLEARLTALINQQTELANSTDVLQGVGYLIAERFGENAELRGRLRRIFHRSGRLVCTKVETPVSQEAGESGERKAESGVGGQPAQKQEAAAAGGTHATEGTDVNVATAVATDASVSAALVAEDAAPAVESLESQPAQEIVSHVIVAQEHPAVVQETAPAEAADTASSETASSPSAEPPAPSPDSVPVDSPVPAGRLFDKPPEGAKSPDVQQALKKAKKKKKKKIIGEHAFKDYYNFQEPLHKVPPHRVLAINRGERARAIRVKIEADVDAMQREAEHLLVPEGHPHAEFLKQCVRDALTRLLIPSLEREIRREQTDKAEEHAVEVFIRNLRKLLLQQPTRGNRVLAIDPGFKSGCKMVALDEFGNVLGHSVVYVIGKEDRRAKARERLANFARQHKAQIVAIGNGTGCRETEQLVADVLAEELKDRDMAYAVVNEAGASIYSTSPLGREELPTYDALQRGAISIGRRLLDPLSEMVKINPANLGVGLYQHDVKAKHLQESLDSVVESCVNFVGVDVNSASPALLRYVSGMNALTARRVYEYRREHGPFKNRDELKKVTGFGDQTFVQSAGFLKIIGGENPLDATWIHPESYEIAQRVLGKLGCELDELAKSVPAPPKPPEKPAFAAELVKESGVSETDAPLADGTNAANVTDVAEVQSAAAVATDSQAATPPLPDTDSPDSQISNLKSEIPPSEPPVPSPEPPASAESAAAEPPPPVRNVIAERASAVDISKLAGELAVGTLLLQDILNSLTRPGLDPRDNVPAPILRRGIMKLEDMQAGMELQGTVLNVVDFGVFVDIGLSDSGLVHISRLADRFIKDPHEVVGVGDVLKVWVVEVDKTRRRVSLTAIAPGTQRPPRPPREERPQRDQRPPRQPRQEGDRRPQGQRGGQPVQQGAGAAVPGGQQTSRQSQSRVPPPHGDRPPRQGGGGGGRRDQRGGNREQYPKTIERPPTKPKVIKPLTKAMEEGKAPMRSFSDLKQLMEKKKEKDTPPPPPPAPPPESEAPPPTEPTA
ncbi:MAG: Tex-like N-terminal domain-containing protein [Pirellulaceae bacterium]